MQKPHIMLGLHFKKYDDFIFTPIVKKEILQADPADKNYITVYLPSYCEPQLTAIFQPINDCRFQIFCRDINQPKITGNITFLPINKTFFNKSLIHCTGIITGGGFETPAEALQLGKKIMAIPIRSQYEQQCNAAALKKMGVFCPDSLETDFNTTFEKWMNSPALPKADYGQSMQQSVEYLFSLYQKSNRKNKFVPELYTEEII